MKRFILLLLFLFLSLNIYGKGAELCVLDVGQGLCCIVTSPDNHTMIFDCGTSSNQRWKDNMAVFQDSLLPYLKKKNIKNIDYVILSHPDFDHYCGLVGLLQKYSVGKYIENGDFSTTIVYKELEKEIKKKSDKRKGFVTVAQAGYWFNLGSDIKFTILSPPYKFKKANDNDISLALRVVYKDTSFVLTGDATQTAEKVMVRGFGRTLKSSVLVVGHHGSHTSTSREFLKIVKPKIAIISCGKNNQYGHPHKEVLTNLKRGKAKIYRTDTDGGVLCISDGKNITVKTGVNHYKVRSKRKKK